MLVPGAQAMRVRVGGRVYGVMPSAGALPGIAGRSTAVAPKSSSATAAPPGWNVSYQGGPVLHTTRPYVIYWDPSGSGITARSEQVINQYLTDVAADTNETEDTYGVGRQYYDSVGIADAGQTFSSSSQAFIDSDAYPTTNNCPAETGYTNCITDAQLQSELSSFVGAHGLPTDGPATELEFPAGAPVYFLILPKTVNTCFDQGGGSADCSGGPSADFGYCAYHDYTTDQAGNVLLYADVPFSVFTESPVKGCQADNPANTALQAPNGDPADNIVDDLSHELNESITDPLITAWVNRTGDGNELADQCETYSATSDPTNPDGPVSANAYVPLGGSAGAGANGYGSLYDQLINGDEYYTQSLWSNGQVNCEMQPTPATLTPSFTVSGGVTGQAATLNPAATISAAGVASETWNFGDGTSSFVQGGLSAVTHTFAAAGKYSVTLTVVDANGNLAKDTQQVAVGGNPIALIGSLHASVTVGSAVSFSGRSSTDPNGAALSNFTWSFGDGGAGSGATVSHTYTKVGTYTVTLKVSDSLGFSASTLRVLDVVAGKIRTVTATHHGTSAYALVAVTGPGTITYARKTAKLARAGTAKIKLTLTAKQRGDLEHKRKFTAAVKLVYTPRGGRRVTETKHLQF